MPDSVAIEYWDSKWIFPVEYSALSQQGYISQLLKTLITLTWDPDYQPTNQSVHLDVKYDVKI